MTDPKLFYIAQLIEKFLTATASLEEEKELNEWLKQNPENKRLLDSFRDSTSIKNELNELSSFNSNEGWVEFRRKLRLKTFFKWIKYAAAAVFFIFSIRFLDITFNKVPPHETVAAAKAEVVKPGGKIAMLLLSDGTIINLEDQQTNLKEKDGTDIKGKNGELIYENLGERLNVSIYNELRVPKGGIYHLSLSDGTKVWLNSMSSIRFPVHFLQKERKVYLEGEAYFEVASIKDAPFMVEVGGNRVEVLGTSFNVNAYDDITKTTLVEGAVKVWKKGEYKFLKPGQLASVSDKIKIEQADIGKALAWQKGEFYFTSDSIEEIMLQLERWYNVEVEIENKNNKSTKVTGRIKRDSPINEVIELLGFASNASFSLEGNLIKVII